MLRRDATVAPLSDAPALPELRDWVRLAEAWRIRRALRECQGNRSAAARLLGIGRRTLYSKMGRLGLGPPDLAAAAPRGSPAEQARKPAAWALFERRAAASS
jgi:DNA-binding NtrC family response regulator